MSNGAMPQMEDREMTKQITKAVATEAARKFVRRYVETGDQWDTGSVDASLPREWRLRDDAMVDCAATIGQIADFIRREAIPA